jgi:hypothetical protein
MAHLLLTLLPLALGAAVSPTLLMVEVFALSAKTAPVAKGWMVAAGSALALAAYTALGLGVGAAASHRGSHHAVDAVVDTVAAGLLGWLLAHQLAQRRRESAKPSLIDRLDSASQRAYFAAGFVMMVSNFSTLILFLPALRLITRAPVTSLDQLVAVAFLLLVALAPVLVPVSLVTMLGRRAQPGLATLNRAVTDHSLAITMTLEAVFFAYFVIKAVLEILAT